jgi:hypothetical protein
MLARMVERLGASSRADPEQVTLGKFLIGRNSGGWRRSWRDDALVSTRSWAGNEQWDGYVVQPEPRDGRPRGKPSA